MKNIKNIIAKGLVYVGIGAVLSTAFSSCRFEDDDYFSESAALRVEHNGEQLVNKLTAAPNGWVIQYFCANDVSTFEGFNLFATFEKNGKVTMASDHRYLRDGNAGKYTEAVSPFTVSSEDGLVLAFNVWNDVLTPFSDPVAPWIAPTIILKDGVGMHGDHNFNVKSYNDNEVIMRGERHQALVRMVKLDRDAKTYIADTKALKEKIWSDNIHSYYVMSGAETLYLDNAKTINKHDGVFRYCDDLDITKAVKADSVSFVFTPRGIRFENPQKIGNSTFQEMTLADDNSALVNEDGTVRMTATWDLFLANGESIQWIDAESLSADLKPLYDAIDAALTANNKNYSLARIGIGKTNNANYVVGLCVQWYTNAFKTARSMGGLALKRSIPAKGQLEIVCEEGAKIDNNLRQRSAAVQAAVRAFGAAINKTYNVTPDSYFVPSATKFVSVDGTTSFSYAQ
jgi:hypothetical protein